MEGIFQGSLYLATTSLELYQTAIVCSLESIKSLRFCVDLRLTLPFPLSRSRAVLCTTGVAGDPVEDAVDVAVTLLGTEQLG